MGVTQDEGDEAHQHEYAAGWAGYGVECIDFYLDDSAEEEGEGHEQDLFFDED